MDYYQGVVIEYLRSDRSTFVNTECLIALAPGKAAVKGGHWYCDAVAANFRDKTIYLCEVTYSTTLQTLLARLQAWSASWPALSVALTRDCGVPPDWHVQPWLFIPEDRHKLYKAKVTLLKNLGSEGNMPKPKVTYLESVAPWKYAWDRKTAEFAAE